MLKLPKIPSSEITPYDLYLNRRRFMTAAGSVAVGALALAGCGTAVTPAPVSSNAAAAPGTGATGDLLYHHSLVPDKHVKQLIVGHYTLHFRSIPPTHAAVP